MKTLNDEGAGAPLVRATNFSIRQVPKSELRKQDRQKTFARVEKSATVAVRYPGLKTLVVNLIYFGRGIVSWGHGIRYRANLETAKSMLHFDCPSPLCKDGGFDLSHNLRSAVEQHQRSIVGAMHCPGFRDQDTGKAAPCESILHFKINLTFITKAGAKTARRLASPAPGRAGATLNYET